VLHAGFVTLRAVLLYAGHGGGGLQLRIVVWNNNIAPSVLPSNYAGQVPPPPPPSSPPPTIVKVVNDVPRGVAASEERDAAWDQNDDMG
jgi:hypothetical protein